jgi:hypothetical protein
MLWYYLEGIPVDERAKDDRQSRRRPGRFDFDCMVVYFGKLFNRTVKGGADRVGTPCIGRPSLRTEQADFRHSALQLVVSFQEDWQAT